MPNEAAQKVESAPTQSATVDESQSTQNTETRPGAEPESQGTKALSDEDKAKRKQRNDERRERRWYEERGAMRAELQQLRDEIKELRTSGPSHSETARSGVPPLKAYLESGRFQTYEEAVDARMADQVAEMREELQAEREISSVETEQVTTSQHFQTQIRDGRKQFGQEAFNDALEVVRENFDDERGNGTLHSNFIVKAKDAATLIMHIGEDPELAETLAGLSYEDFVAEIGAIRRDIKASRSSQETTTTNSSKPPKVVASRDTAPDKQGAMRQAADKNDFASWRRAYHGKP